ncbi:hypothetical protein CROQUDRAFT_97742 [Cronartium quercuum f. sp. fusiforme G11]|uniref:Uncharacterized protein n=1 Tax=Cronartium quercuum f. sp. fusiforme G11 TaxID=708437 RepID=A0A9P6NDP2_9BASI|nr:hypothetical protein CROQUDRAFT_97742 [Cronartium quercuum f. sp. fusiforme G11]
MSPFCRPADATTTHLPAKSLAQAPPRHTSSPKNPPHPTSLQPTPNSVPSPFLFFSPPPARFSLFSLPLVTSSSPSFLLLPGNQRVLKPTNTYWKGPGFAVSTPPETKRGLANPLQGHHPAPKKARPALPVWRGRTGPP